MGRALQCLYNMPFPNQTRLSNEFAVEFRNHYIRLAAMQSTNNEQSY